MISGVPNKIPPDFVPRVLAGLLPSPAAVAKMSRDQLMGFLKEKEDLERLIDIDPARFFRPNVGGQEEFMTAHDPRKRVFCYFAGNKGGKTTAGAIRTLEACLGYPLWGKDWRQEVGFRHKPPIRGCVFAEDFDSHKEVTVPALLSWCPKKEKPHIQKNSAGQYTQFTFPCGSILHFRTYEQGADKAEGKDWHIVWPDEPPTREIYVSIFRGLVAMDGIMLITATLLKEAWLYDEKELDHVQVFEGSIHDNAWISFEAKEDFLNSLDDDERQTREWGKPSSLTGVIYKNFRDGPPFIVQDYKLRADYPIIMGVDPHERRPIHIMYGQIDPYNDITWFQHNLIPPRSIEEIQLDLAEAEKHFPQSPVICVMDPNRGKAPQAGGTSWEDIFTDFGYSVKLGEDDIRSGHTAVRKYLLYSLKPDGRVSRPPRMRWTEDCRGKLGPIYQMLRYSWEDWANKKVSKSKKETPKQVFKDFPDIIRYVAKEDFTYDVLSKGHEILDLLPESMKQRGRIRAYR